MTSVIALARLEHHPFGGVWIVASCPFCGREHRHGGGGASENPRDFLGHRNALCLPGDVPPTATASGGYVLVEASAVTPPADKQLESGPNSSTSNSADSTADTTTPSGDEERVSGSTQRKGQPDGPTEKRVATREPQVEPGQAEGCEIGRTKMSRTMLKAGIEKLAGMTFADMTWIYKRAQGSKPPVGTSKATLLETLTEMFTEKAKVEGEPEVLSADCEAWLSEVGDGKPAPKKADAAPTPAAKAEKPIKMPKAPKAAKEPRERDPRLPAPGTTITKLWRDRKLEVLVNETDFTFEGKQYRSLSRIAMELMGTAVNGLLFFSLTEGAKAAQAKREEKAAAKQAADAAKAEAPKPEKKPKKQAKAKSPKKSKAKSK
jgi:hypothetical protein